MYIVHMAIKTVSLKSEAYEPLRSARRYPGESFSEVILRARWPEDTITGALWIAAAGLAHQVPVVSRNARYFERVPGLSVVSYAQGPARPKGVPS